MDGKNKKDTERKKLRILNKWIPETKASGPQFRDPMSAITGD